MTRKLIVVLSSGLDSTFNLVKALDGGHRVHAITFDYGQRAAPRELAFAESQCRDLGVSWERVDLPWFSRFTSTSLVSRESSVPVGEDVQTDSLEQSRKTAAQVWVPNRNGIFINIAAGFAEGMGFDGVVVGFNKEEAATFPDNSASFVRAVNQALLDSTRGRVEVLSMSLAMGKPEIVQELLASSRFHEALGWHRVWPCYSGGEVPCGTCESCQRDRKAMNLNGIQWPWGVE